ncbi:MAG: hypothetical protein AB7S26_13870 [Sandaracinaceae bacterium]
MGRDAGPPSGSDAGPRTGGDAGPGGGLDAGPPIGSDGGGVVGCPSTPPTVDVRFGGCDALSPCGGNVEGVWVYDDVCVAMPMPDLSACPQARIEDLAGTAQGCVELDGTMVDRDVTTTVSFTVVVPASCTLGLGCTAIESALGVTCAVDGTDCRCPISETYTASNTDTYTVAGSVLTTGDGHQYDFCVGGAGLSYEEHGASPDEPGVVRLVH